MKYDGKLYAEHLQSLCRFATVSNEDPEKMDWKEFVRLHAYLEETYPFVHKTLKKEIIGKAGLLYHWEGTGMSHRLPVLVMAHQDVVPPGDLSQWKYPPFEGHIDEDGILWARGCCDCKNYMQAEMDAVEMLIREGFVPDYDIYMAYGYNEEVMGGEHAACLLIANELEKRGVKLGLVIDEGGGVIERDGNVIANIRVAEKGYADHEFYVEGAGGHPMLPPKHNALGKLGRALWILEENPMEPVLCDAAAAMMKAQAEFTEGHLGELYKDPYGNWEELKEAGEVNLQLNSLIRTTTTPTMAQGAVQANILPARAQAVTNSRLLPGQTLEDLMEHFRQILPEDVHVRLLKGHDAPPVSSADNYAYRLLAKITKDMHPDAKIVPMLVGGGTDSRYYCRLCPENSVYRYSAGRVSTKSGGAHAVNEHIDLQQLESHVEFFVRVFMEYNGVEIC